VTNTDYIIQQFTKQLVTDKIDISEITELQKTLQLILEAQDKEELIEFFKKNKHEKLASFCELFTFSTEPSSAPSFKNIPDYVLEAALTYFPERTQEELNYQISNCVKFGHPLNYNEISRICHAIFNKRYVVANKNTAFVPFLITPNESFEGQIVSKTAIKKNLRLGEVYVKKNGEGILVMIGDKIKLNWSPTHVFDKAFYHYVMMGTDNTTYQVFAEDDINPQWAKVTGIKLLIKDQMRVGDAATLGSNSQIVIAHSIEPQFEKLTKDKFEEITEGLTHEKLWNNLFGEFRHPDWFMDFTLAMLFSSKFDGYPLHFVWVGPAGSGKSMWLDLMQASFKEIAHIFEGSSSTFKMLTVSHKGDVPKIGHFCSCRRVCLADELLAPLKRRGKGASSSDETHLMTNLLEHKGDRVAGSGNKGTVIVNPTARLLAVSNIGNNYGFNNFVDVADKISNPFISRSLWYIQTDAHTKFCQDRSTKFQTKKRPKLKGWNDIVRLSDYLMDVELDVDVEEVKKIHENCRHLVPEGLNEVYNTPRYKHHIACLIDGFAKLYSVVEDRDRIEIRKTDVDRARDCFTYVINTWDTAVDMHNISHKMRLEYLKPNQKQVYDIINQDYGCNREAIKEIYAANPDFVLRQLIEAGLVKKVGVEFYPFWHKRAKTEVTEVSQL